MQLFVFFALMAIASCNNPRKREISEILESVRRIEEILNKEERLREITDIVRIDSTMDKVGKKLDHVVALLEDSNSVPATGRMSTDLAVTSNLAGIERRMVSLEASLQKLEASMEQHDLSLQKIDEIERRTTQMKDDINVKLRKIMNVVSAVYEQSKDMKVNLGSRAETPQSEGGSTNFAAEFFVENLEELERKIKEQFSVLTSEIRTEITSLKIVASTLTTQCQPTSEDEDGWMDTPEFRSGRSGGDRMVDTLDNLVETLGKSTREIREEIQQGIQDIDHKLANLTALAPHCDPLDTAESIVSSRRSVDVFQSIPDQDVEERIEPGSQKNESCTKNAPGLQNQRSCYDLRKGGATCDGIYVIFPMGVRAVRVYCDMTTDGGGWTVLMRRGDFGDKMTSFHRNWYSYRNGFGNAEGEFWLGNDNIYMMTNEEDNALRIHMSSFDGDSVDIDYSSFSVANESDSYRLHIGPPVGKPSNAANSLRYHNNHPFSTFDRQNDNFQQNCAATYKGGWWFNGCYFGFLTGEYFRPEETRENWQGILWYDWKGNSALKGAHMMIRPKSATRKSRN